MGQTYSFDIVSQLDFQEVDNAVNQAVKEIKTRFDFKGSKSSIEFLKDQKKIKLIADDELKLRNLHDILKTRMAARKIPLKAMQFREPEPAFEGTLLQEIELIHGIPQDKAKDIVKHIKDSKFKVQASIQGDEIRVSGKSKDDLQAVMGGLKQISLDLPIQFTNYR